MTLKTRTGTNLQTRKQLPSTRILNRLRPIRRIRMHDSNPLIKTHLAMQNILCRHLMHSDLTLIRNGDSRGTIYGLKQRTLIRRISIRRQIRMLTYHLSHGVFQGPGVYEPATPTTPTNSIVRHTLTALENGVLTLGRTYR